MVQISLINMNSGKLVEQMAGGSIEVQLPSIVKVSLSPEALKSYYRSGNDLIIELKSGEEIVLKDFFIVSADGQRNELVLEDNGRFWHATNGQNEASLSLKEITGIDELLLGESSDNTYMWLLGAIALGGGVAALASGGGGGGGGGGIKPAVPVIRFDPQSGKVTVEGKPGATVQLKDAAGNAVGAPVTLNAQGKGELQVPPTLSDQKVTATQTVDGVESLPSVEVTVPLLKPTVVADANTGTVAVSGKPGASVQLQDKEGNPVGSPVTLNAQGQGVIPLPQSTSGESLEVVQTSDGVKSPTSEAVVVPTLKPVVGAVDPQTGKVAVEGKPGATVQLKDAAGNAVGAPVTLNAQGKGELQVPPTLSDQKVTATQTVDGVESLPSVEVTVPLLKPTVVADANTGTVAVSGKPGASVQLQDKEGNPVGSPVTLNAQGQGVIPLPQSTSGESHEVVQTSDGVKSPTSEAVVVPTLKPVVGAVDPQTGKVAVEGKPGATVQLKDAAGNAVGAPVTLNAQGKGELQVPPTLSDQKVTATQTVDGVESLPSVEVTVPLLKPTVVADANTGTVAVSGKPGASVQLQDKEGNPVGSPVTLNAQGQGVIPLPQSTSGESLEAVQTSDGVKSPTSEAVVAPTLKPVVGAVDPQTGKVAVEGKPGATVQLKDAAGNAVGAPVTLNAQGQGELQVPPTLSDQKVTATQTVDGVESLPSVEVTVPLLKPTVVADANTGTVAVSGKPGASVQLQDKEGNPVGSPVTLNAQGQGVIPLPQSTSGESLEAVQTSDGVKSPISDAVVVPTLKPVVGAVDPQTGKVAVEGKPGATVQLKDAAGNAVGAPVTLNAQGQGELQVPPTLSDQKVTATQTVDGVESLPSVEVTVPLLKPTVVADANTGTVAVSGKPGASVQLQDEEGNLIGSPVVLDAQGQGVIPLSQSIGGEQVSVLVKDGDLQSPASTIDVPLLIPQMGAFDTRNNLLEVNGKPGATVQLKNSMGQPIGDPLLLDEKGQVTFELLPQLSAQKITATQTINGVESAPAEAVVPLLAPVLGPINEETRDVTVSGKPGAIFQILNELTGRVYYEGVFDEDGEAIVNLPASASGQRLVASQREPTTADLPLSRTVSDQQKMAIVEKQRTEKPLKSDLSLSVEAPLFKPDLTIDRISNVLKVEGMPGAIVEVRDPAGIILGRITLNNEGKARYPFLKIWAANLSMQLSRTETGHLSQDISRFHC